MRRRRVAGPARLRRRGSDGIGAPATSSAVAGGTSVSISTSAAPPTSAPTPSERPRPRTAARIRRRPSSTPIHVGGRRDPVDEVVGAVRQRDEAPQQPAWRVQSLGHRRRHDGGRLVRQRRADARGKVRRASLAPRCRAPVRVGRREESSFEVDLARNEGPRAEALAQERDRFGQRPCGDDRGRDLVEEARERLMAAAQQRDPLRAVGGKPPQRAEARRASDAPRRRGGRRSRRAARARTRCAPARRPPRRPARGW